MRRLYFYIAEKNRLYYHQFQLEKTIHIRASFMKFTLPLKIFISFLVLSVLSVTTMVLVMRFFAVRSFEGYIHEKEMENLGYLVESAAKFYQENAGWDKLKTDPKLWMQLIGEIGDSAAPHPLEQPGKPPMGGSDFPPDGSHPSFPPGQIPPPPRPDSGRPEPPQFPPPGGFGLREMAPRISLFDRQKKIMAGPADDPAKFYLLPVTLKGETIGWLGLHKGLGPRHLPQPDREFLYHQIRALYSTGIIILVLSALAAFGLSRHLLAPIQKLTRATASITSRDFNARVQVDTSDELGQLARDFNAMAQTLGAFEDRQKQWLSDISHEMRTPLTVMLCEIEAIQDGIHKADPASMASLHAEAEDLAGIVADLHTLSLSEAGALPMEKNPVLLSEVVQKTLGLFKTRFEQNGIKPTLALESGAGQTVLGDEARLTQVFTNLFENVLRYANKPGTLQVRQIQAGDKLVISVEDSGPGVPEASLPRLFDRLYRVDQSRSRATGGSGLGLSISKAIVEAHGGTIRALNGLQGGLRVEIELPLR